MGTLYIWSDVQGKDIQGMGVCVCVCVCVCVWEGVDAHACLHACVCAPTFRAYAAASPVNESDCDFATLPGHHEVVGLDIPVAPPTLVHIVQDLQ